MSIIWISEAVEMPKIAQSVFFTKPRQTGEFWDIYVAQLLCRHEGVVPFPVDPGGQWPTDYFWGINGSARHNILITGNGYWAHMGGIALPPNADHRQERGYHYIRQLGEVFVPQGARR